MFDEHASSAHPATTQHAYTTTAAITNSAITTAITSGTITVLIMAFLPVQYSHELIVKRVRCIPENILVHTAPTTVFQYMSSVNTRIIGDCTGSVTLHRLNSHL